MKNRFHGNGASGGVNNNSSGADISKAKSDLLSLGIDLDDDLIQRLQLNLGIERIFAVARKAANLIKDKPNSKLGEHPHIIYRNVSSDHMAHGASISPFRRDLVHMDGKLSASILSDLHNRNTAVEPQHRSAVDRVIESFAVLYARGPDRFVARMLGKKYKSTDKQDVHNVSKQVLKARYVNEEEFSVMIGRIDSTLQPQITRALFLLLAEDKSFATNKKRQVVDLWGFFTLLKTASEQSRRSFDGRTSKIASDVEFWKSKNSTMELTQKSSDFSSWMDSAPINDQIAAENNKRFNSDANNKASRNEPNSRVSLHKLDLESSASIAELLGSKQYPHRSSLTQGKNIMGNFSHEILNTGNVPDALHSPLKSTHNRNSHARVDITSKTPIQSADDSVIPTRAAGRHTKALRGSSMQIGAVLGYEAPKCDITPAPRYNDLEERCGIFGPNPYLDRAKSTERIRPHSAISVLHRETLDRGSVASALGSTREDRTFPTKGEIVGTKKSANDEPNPWLTRRNSFGALQRGNVSLSVKDALHYDDKNS